MKLLHKEKLKKTLSFIFTGTLTLSVLLSGAACQIQENSSDSSLVNSANSSQSITIEDGVSTYYQLPSVPKGKYDDYYTSVLYFPNSGAHRESTDNYKPFEETEWGVTAVAEPRFEGHHQPNVPAWGYTNASDPKVMAKEVEAMVDYGIDCIGFDWYWTKERRENNTGMRKDGTDGMYLSEELEYGFLRAENCTDIDFYILWCNEAESANGQNAYQDWNEWNIMTDYIIEHYFKQPNYSRYDGKLVFAIYNLQNFVNQIRNEYGATDVRLAKQALDEFREKVRAAGLGELCIQVECRRATCVDESVFNFMAAGGVLVGDDGTEYTFKNWDALNACKYLGIEAAMNYYFPNTNVEKTPVKCYSPEDNGATVSMKDVVDASFRILDKNGNSYTDRQYLEWASVGIKFYTGFNAGADCTPRVRNSNVWDYTLGYPHGCVMIDDEPYVYQQGLLEARNYADKYNDPRVTVGAWNEWGEGGFLKPDTRYGYGKLRAVKNVLGD